VILEADSAIVTITVGPRVTYRFELQLPNDAGIVVVADDDVDPPRGSTLECRAEGLWFACICETPGEHWSFGLEAFGLRYDTAAEAALGGYGERLAVGYDLEWEVLGSDGSGRVTGEILVATDVLDIDTTGRFAP
jgi:hypothetical protein